MTKCKLEAHMLHAAKMSVFYVKIKQWSARREIIVKLTMAKHLPYKILV